jgi:tetratricopeptide (TPR) repeat protein
MANNKKEKSTDKLVLFVGIISSVTGITSNITKLIESKSAILLLILGLILVSLYFLINHRKEINDRFKIYLILRIACIIAVSIIVIFLIKNNFHKRLNKRCVFNEHLIAIGISRFDKDDNFSSLVFEFLKEKELPDTIFDIEKIDNNYFESISDSIFNKALDSLCIASGILVSGKRSENDKLFYCKIKLHAFYKADSSKSELIVLRNPDIQEFSIDYQAQILVDFIMAIISYNQRDYENAEKYFERCINQNKNEANRKFLSICHNYMGNIYYSDNPKRAIQEFQESYKLYANNTSLENLTNYYMSIGDYYKAKECFNQIENKKEIDIEEIRKKLNQLELGLGILKTSHKDSKKIQIPPKGSFYVRNSDSSRLTINYTSITQFVLKNQTYFIYKADNGLFGIFDSYGVLIKLPDFKELLDAENYLREKLK